MISVAAQALATCLLMASNTYQVPAAVMIGIMHVEGGHVGQAMLNNNGTYDLGPMQVNSIWMPQLAQAWHVSIPVARSWVRDDGCVNVHVAAWILKQKMAETGSLYGGIAHYHSATPHLGSAYARKVIKAMDQRGLIAHEYAAQTPLKYEYAQR